MPQIDKKDFHWFLGVKFGVTVFLFYHLPWYWAALFTIVLSICYRYPIAYLKGLQVMDTGDFNTFITNQKAPANIMTCTPVSVAKPEYAREAFMRVVKAHVKARSCIVTVLGDKYYKELDAQKVIDSQIEDLPDGFIKTQEDAEKFVSEQISSPLPLDRPQWRVWVQRKYQDDEKGIVIWKAHHSLADGVSSMAFNLQMDQTYDIKKLIPFREIGFWERNLVRLMVPFYLPIILWESYLRRRDRNPIHDGRRKLTGQKRVAMSKEYDFLTIKMTSRSLQCTINELMVSALSIATARLFKQCGDEKTKRMRIAVPCNIRWKYYNTYDEVELENKFAPMPLKIDLQQDLQTAVQSSKRVSRDMKKAFAKIYAMYFLSLVTSYFIPVFMLKIMAEKMTKPFTMAFSNTPGVLRRIHYKDVSTLGMISSFVCAGRVAISIAILSYAENIQFSVLADTCVQQDPKEIRKQLELALDELIALGMKIEDGRPEDQKLLKNVDKKEGAEEKVKDS